MKKKNDTHQNKTDNLAYQFDTKWREKLKSIQESFPSPWREEGDDQIFEHTFLDAVGQLNKMKHHLMRIYNYGINISGLQLQLLHCLLLSYLLCKLLDGD